jgi:phenylpropionate dioxygenase-like ring-hydroxylating dioxygenase large terminal subunit
VVVVRDLEVRLRAFPNTCRHRGSRVCTADKGAAVRLVCPYHQWSYGLDGRLLFARQMADGFDKTKFNLKPIACESVAGYVFISLAETPPDFAPFRSMIEPYFAPHRLNEAKLAYEHTIIEKGNWKLERPAVRRRLSDDAATDQIGTLMLFHYPTTWNHVLTDHAVTFRVLPLSATETALTTKWLVHKDAVAGVDYDLESSSTCGPKPTIKIAGSWRKTHAAFALRHTSRDPIPRSTRKVRFSLSIGMRASSSRG